MKPLRLISFGLLCLVLWACQADQPDPTSNFSIVYDNSEFDQISAISIRQTEDGGYLVLGTLGNSGLSDKIYYDAAYLLRLDATGKTIWTSRENIKFRDYINPVPQLIVIGNNYFFWSLKLGGNLQTQKMELVRVSDTDRTPHSVYSVSSGIRPWYALKTKNNELVLVGVEISQNERGEEKPYTKVVKLDKSFNVVWEKKFLQGETRKYPRLEELLPEYFFCIEAQYQNKEVYVFNTISEDGSQVISKMLDTQKGDSVSQKVIKDVFPIALTQWTENTFAGAFTNLRDIDLNSNYIWNNNDSNYLLNAIFHELALGHRIVATSESIKSKDIRVFGATTKNFQIILYTWAKNGDRFDVAGRLYLGASNVYKIADFIRTKDGGMAVVGTTIVAERFSRISLFKLSESQVNALAP